MKLFYKHVDYGSNIPPRSMPQRSSASLTFEAVRLQLGGRELGVRVTADEHAQPIGGRAGDDVTAVGQ